MKNLHKWFPVFAIFICLISKGQASEIPFTDDQKYFKEVSSFDLINDALERIKKGTYLPEIDRNCIKAIPISELTHFESTVKPEDELFDSWIALILFLFPDNFDNFNGSLREAVNKENNESITPQAQNNLGIIYRIGKGVCKDPIKAIKWYKKAAFQGHAKAQFNLGSIYYNGESVDKNPTQAFEWYKKAALQGHVDAQYNVGVMYHDGEGVDKNPTQAFEWFEKATLQGHAKAQCNLGAMYCNGEGVNKNPTQAFTWFEKSALQGHVEAQYNLGVFYRDGHGVNKDLKKSFGWYQKAALQGHVEAQYNLGVFYRDGHGVNKDLKKSFGWYQKAALQGCVTAQHSLGAMYCNGEGTNQDFTKSLKWILESYKNAKATNLKLQCENAIKKLVTFIIPFEIMPEDEIDFKTNQDTLKSNLEAFLGLHILELLINQPKSSFKEANYAIFSLSQLYDRVVEAEIDLLMALRAYDSPGFMVTCLQPNDIDRFKAGHSSDIKYYFYQNTHYLTFGRQNIQAADNLMAIFSYVEKIGWPSKEIIELLEIQGQKKRTL